VGRVRLIKGGSLTGTALLHLRVKISDFGSERVNAQLARPSRSPDPTRLDLTVLTVLTDPTALTALTVLTDPTDPTFRSVLPCHHRRWRNRVAAQTKAH